MTTRTECHHEIERLHDAFVSLYTGESDEMSPVEDALAPDFEMVAPSGDVLGREAVLTMIREKVGSYAPGTFGIDIRNVAVVESAGGVTVCRYEEWQTTPDDETGRMSTVVFRSESGTPGGLSWVSVHETWH